ncbi:hypothetical protein M5K25_022384 [Dendrobium thyrsiflorum]|uniref:Uncharacterized protein n=1 Tax=Dendrobium thyrsiflorum TaxID=117978 RepID=A0ABD0U661_DENTH
MGMSHDSPEQPDVHPTAAVSSKQRALISKYRASAKTQSSKVEMINILFKPVIKNDDDDIIRELPIDFYKSSEKRKLEQITGFRDGVTPLFSDPSAGVVPVCSVGLTIWSRIWGKCNLGQAAVSVKPFSYRKFLFGVFSFSETSFSSHSLTVLRGHFLFHDHHGHQDSIFPELPCISGQFQFSCQVLGVFYQKCEPVWYGSG